MIEFYTYAPLILWLVAILTSITDRYYPFILLIMSFSHMILGELSNTLNIYQLVPLFALFSFGLGILSAVFRKLPLVVLFVFQGLIYSWYLTVDLYVGVMKEGQMLLTLFMYNGLHPDYVYSVIPLWMNLPSVMGLSILLYIAVRNGMDIYTNRNNLPTCVADNLRDMRDFIVSVAVEIRKDIKNKNPKAFFKAWKGAKLGEKKSSGSR